MEASPERNPSKLPKNPLWRTGPVRDGSLGLATISLPIWSCSVWGLPCHPAYAGCGALLPHLFTLTCAACTAPSCEDADSAGGIFSVALAVFQP